tara:strand:- start:681 stop:1094 length:414 start_codon:yes stop_codon:yes gene_type:complete
MAPVQPSASVAAPGLGIRYIGSGNDLFAYALSGAVISTSGSESPNVLLLDFTTGSGFIDSQILFVSTVASNNKLFFKVSFNAIEVLRATSQVYYEVNISPMRVIIPPRTHVQVYWGVGNETADKGSCIISGKVYGAK